ncbi:YhjD/YihY/BrkB family envelope integrity protein [Streptomyces sp. NPDC059639]|uniref:YhjD/YihY/BrkB family envelope integrity protein n=1 Tax=Streptomyces sp. NPDC059639 TaxID=3346891 RepID=UPI0036A6F560
MAIAEAARPLVARIGRQLVRVTVLDMSTRLAAQAFLAALPMLIAVASLCPAPVRHEMRRSLHMLIGTSGPVAADGDVLTRGMDESFYNWGAVGLLVALLSATSFTRALQRLCERAWELPRSGVRYVAWRWALWLAVWIALLVLQGSMHRAFGAGAVLGVTLQLVESVLMWWWTQHLLLAGRVPWLPLLPGALLAGGGVVAFCVTSGVWLPRALRVSEQRYGPLGSVFTLLSWLIVFFTVVVAGVAIGRVLAQEEFVRRWTEPAVRQSVCRKS